MSIKQHPIGIFGGTFDPIHLGHLFFAKEAYQNLSLQQVRFIPAYQPVHRDIPEASAADRLNMVKLAIANQPEFTVDDLEIKRKGPSYMIDTLVTLRKEIMNTPLCLLLANDAFTTFDSWHRWQEIPNYTHLIIVNRPDINFKPTPALKNLLHQHQTENKNLLFEKLNGYIYFMEMPALAISATEIRQQIAAGQKPKDELSPAVWEYIKEHQLYCK